MSATEAAPDGPQHRKGQNRTEVLLACAGGLVIADAFCAHIMWAGFMSKGPGFHPPAAAIYIPLSAMFIAFVLSCAAVLCPDNAGKTIGQSDPIRGGSRLNWMILTAMILLHAAMMLSILRSHAGIDVVTFQNDASKTLLQGVDPYGLTQANIYTPNSTTLFYGPGQVVNGRVQVGFQYPPLTLLWAVPGYVMGDIRYSYLLAVIISACLLFAICPNLRSLYIAFVLLFNPLTILVEFLGWTEPLILMTLSAAVYAALKKRWWLPVALGLFLATKQYNILAVPLIALLICPFRWKAYWRITGWSLAVCATTVFPFALWNVRALWHDLVLFHLAQPFRHDGLSFAVPFPWMVKIGPLLVLAFIAWVLRTGKHNAVVFVGSYGVALLLFVSTSQQGMANYYFLIGQTFFLAVAALSAMSTNSESGSDYILHTPTDKKCTSQAGLPGLAAPAGR